MNTSYRKLLQHEIKTFINSSPPSKELAYDSIKNFKFFPPNNYIKWQHLLPKEEFTAYVDWLINVREKLMLPTDFSATTIIIIARYLSILENPDFLFEKELFMNNKPNHFISAFILTSKLMEYPVPSIKQFSDVLKMDVDAFWIQNMRIELNMIKAFCCRFGVPPISRSELVRRVAYAVWFVGKIENIIQHEDDFNSELFWTVDREAVSVVEKAFFFADMSLYDTNLLACNPYDIAIACLILGCKAVESTKTTTRMLQYELISGANAIVKIRTPTVRAIESLITKVVQQKQVKKIVEELAEP